MTDRGERRICAIHQPHYLPWPRYLHKIAAADVFVLLDDVQYTRNGWQNRNRFKGPAGPYLVTVPVRRGLRPIREVEIAGDDWRRRHLQALRSSYGRAPGFSLVEDLLTAALSRPWHHLADLCETLLVALLEALGIRTAVVRSSALAVDGRRSERLARLCAATGATHYLSGRYALDTYLQPAELTARGVAVLYQDWRPPRYLQVHPQAGFVADLSVIDLLACAPHDAPRLLLDAGRVVDPQDVT